MAFVWELTKETIHLPLGGLQGGTGEAVQMESGMFSFVITISPTWEREGFVGKEFHFKNSDAMKFTTQHDLY